MIIFPWLFQVIVGRYGEKPKFITEGEGKTRVRLSASNKRHINITYEIRRYLNSLRDGVGCFIPGTAVSRRFSQFCEKRLFGFVMSVCPSARPHGTTRLPLDGFLRNYTIEYFRKDLSRKFKFH